jgi:hypothetical protein
VLDLRSAIIVYDGLPISSGGAHHIAIRNMVTVWAQLSEFLRECAISVEYRKVELWFESGPSAPDSSEDTRLSATRLFGLPERRPLVSSSDGVRIYFSSWRLTYADIPRALDWLSEQDNPLDDYGMATTGLGMEIFFKLVDPHSGQALPFQGAEHYGHQNGFRSPLGISWVNPRLSSKSTCGIELSLPYEEVTDELRETIAYFQKYLPFKLSRKHWSRWQLNKAGTRYYARKISVF